MVSETGAGVDRATTDSPRDDVRITGFPAGREFRPALGELLTSEGMSEEARPCAAEFVSLGSVSRAGELDRAWF